MGMNLMGRADRLAAVVPLSRRNFFAGSLAATAALGLKAANREKEGIIQGFDETDAGMISDKPWEPFSDKKVRVGIAGYGLCHFGGVFEFQHHPNVEIVAAAELFPDRLDALVKRLELDKPEKRDTFRTYSSAEDMIDQEKDLDAVWLATDAPSHLDLVLRALRRGLHVSSAVPALFGFEQLDRAQELIDAVKKSGKIYAMFETSVFRPEFYAMRKIYEADGFGEIKYAEGEYYHYSDKHHASYTRSLGDWHEWRKGLPPMFYPTHSNAFYTCLTGKAFTEVSCYGVVNPLCPKSKDNLPNYFNNPFGSEIGLFKTETGGIARMAVCWDLPGICGEIGRVSGERGSYGMMNWARAVQKYDGLADISKLDLGKPRLPPGVKAGEHGGSHGYLTDDFIRAILLGRKPAVDVVVALNTTVPGLIAHKSAIKDGETLKIPIYKW